ncbi:tRNA (adenosine(37)-N6)-dimethylallyltransferase MiaA [Candidatus Nomurabacteria bacterium]|nr:tRNA (adenosine(37)-N6)-dimethylallyltransferase MiaA [Candidatus Nomurabacteria bacterium]
MNKVIVILGQTATGKSDLAVKIAKLVNGEVISADSRQVYIGLDIGTGKITTKEMQGIPHHLLSVVKTKNKFSVGEYKKLAEEKIEEIISRSKTPIICGGTGFYIDAVTRGMILPDVPPNLKLRKNLDKKSNTELFKMLKKLDNKRAQNIDKNNKVRLIRAIEIAKILGKVPELVEIKPNYKFIKIGLYLPTPKLQKSVEARVKKMFKNGLLKEIFEYNEPTEDKVIKETIKYAKRQMTWFKRDKKIKWFDSSKLKTKEVLKFFN